MIYNIKFILLFFFREILPFRLTKPKKNPKIKSFKTISVEKKMEPDKLPFRLIVHPTVYGVLKKDIHGKTIYDPVKLFAAEKEMSRCEYDNILTQLNLIERLQRTRTLTVRVQNKKEQQRNEQKLAKNILYNILKKGVPPFINPSTVYGKVMFKIDADANNNNNPPMSITTPPNNANNNN